MATPITATARKGRGAIGQTPSRFSKTIVEPLVEPLESEAQQPYALKTTLRPMHARRIISNNQSPDIPFERSINPYMGCEHGCVYCYARVSHSYLDLSPGLDFETQIFYKPNAAERLLQEWTKPGYQCKPITIGANTDPYQPAEKKLGITRQLLALFLKYRHPVSLISKGVLMQRDLDILQELARQSLCSVAISIPTMSDSLKRVLEPRVPAASARLKLMTQLTEVGVPVTLLMAPIIPALNDSEIEKTLEAAASSGAIRAQYILLRLPNELKQIFSDWLNVHKPQRASHVMSLIRQASGGRDYDNRFKYRQRGSGPYAEMLQQRFASAARRNSLQTGGSSVSQMLDCIRFIPPGQIQMAF